MLDISAQLGTFDSHIHPDVMAGLIASWVRPLIETNVVFLTMHRNVPSLYRSGVYYQEEPFGLEDFFDVPTILKQGHADCEDLAAWRAAELKVAGYWSDVLVTWEALELDTGDIDILFHVRTLTPYGVEDPSEILGMNSELAWGARH